MNIAITINKMLHRGLAGIKTGQTPAPNTLPPRRDAVGVLANPGLGCARVTVGGCLQAKGLEAKPFACKHAPTALLPAINLLRSSYFLPSVHIHADRLSLSHSESTTNARSRGEWTSAFGDLLHLWERRFRRERPCQALPRILSHNTLKPIVH
ncbi:hypothetical protein Y5S_02254 [Alcanivorax nanhaiticus]|uniref:Uncharacterized protein n=1 Tax=Alcanivorax nanhaiticus TaxID=1177154 RepID=A0A095SJJ2_9GAMM|nr:hypothetical protein Y5S_02254 [Alcanivorax nanhaiticus]